MAGTGTGVGADIFGVCRRCGEVWHVVVAVLNGRIAKVECKQCGARHGHRPSSAERAAAPRRRLAHAARLQRAEAVEADPSRPPRRYQPDDRYQAGDRMLHPSFGEGVVQSVSGPQKVLVRFSSGDKTLVQARSAS
ncbi:MAG: hypothetical protein JRG92_21070 [Deltaproteobacteria bacterium]|nr:hypothetical protein [Deltaproteobacteria bacterium]